jgi:hypothetical protein
VSVNAPSDWAEVKSTPLLFAVLIISLNFIEFQTVKLPLKDLLNLATYKSNVKTFIAG